MAKDEPFEPAGQFCPECTCNNLLSATRCEVCGAALRGLPARPEPDPEESLIEETDGDSVEALDSVPSDQRVSLGNFPSDYEADLAAGLLRSYGIAVEITPPGPYGARTPELWTARQDIAEARRILDHVAHGPESREPD